MKVLLAIKPEFAEKIFDGTKKYEFRKSIYKRSGIKKIVVYASSPVQQVIGEFSVESVLSDHPENLWKETQEYSGITKEFFQDYFQDRDLGFAIKVKKIKKFKKPLCLKKDYNIHFAPQSYLYLS